MKCPHKLEDQILTSLVISSSSPFLFFQHSHHSSFSNIIYLFCQHTLSHILEILTMKCPHKLEDQIMTSLGFSSSSPFLFFQHTHHSSFSNIISLFCQHTLSHILEILTMKCPCKLENPIMTIFDSSSSNPLLFFQHTHHFSSSNLISLLSTYFITCSWNPDHEMFIQIGKPNLDQFSLLIQTHFSSYNIPNILLLQTYSLFCQHSLSHVLFILTMKCLNKLVSPILTSLVSSSSNPFLFLQFPYPSFFFKPNLFCQLTLSHVLFILTMKCPYKLVSPILTSLVSSSSNPFLFLQFPYPSFFFKPNLSFVNMPYHMFLKSWPWNVHTNW